MVAKHVLTYFHGTIDFELRSVRVGVYCKAIQI